MWRWDRAPWRASPRLICALTGGDGAEGAEHAEPTESTDPVRTILVSDERWTCGEGPVRFDSMYEGETYDDRRSPSDWGPVAVVSGPGGALVERPHEPVSAQTAVEPQWRRSASGWIGDVGQMMAGVARYDLPLETGQQVSVRFGEKLDESGELVCANEHIYTPRFQTDVLIGAGRRLHWQPEFSYKGFQYLSVEGLGRRPAPGEVVAVPLVQQVRRAVEFECDVPIFTQLVEVMRTTVLNNLHHIPTDTPIYEKNGWTGDVLVGMDTMSGLFDLRRLFTKWLDDVAATQLPSGQLAVIAPSPGWGYEHGECAPAPEWSCLFPGLLLHLANVYGDLGPARRHWQSCRRYLDWELTQITDAVDESGGSTGAGGNFGTGATGGGLASSELGDYLSPGYIDGPPPEDSRLSASCFLHRGLLQGAELAARLDAESGAEEGRRGSLEAWLDAAESLRGQINEVFLDRERGCYRTASDPHGQYRQTSNLMPLALGIVPEEMRGPVVESLVADVRRRDHHLNTGHIGTSLLLNVLTDAGFGADAFRVATQRSCPSWGSWLDLSATTMWERWNAGARSRDHFFLGTVVDWILTRVAGVRRIAPGWAVVRVQPGLVDGVSRCRTTRPTSRGVLTVDWDLHLGRLSVDVPEAMVCQLELGGPTVVAEAGESVWQIGDR
ncbi:family 78 glycoside hydrolase catalytic domain [Acidipropionibacterium jensenii]|nr:family 78 glycoside hydrolase catalytic domain [Acidipropionibacterium jensenii]